MREPSQPPTTDKEELKMSLRHNMDRVAVDLSFMLKDISNDCAGDASWREEMSLMGTDLSRALDSIEQARVRMAALRGCEYERADKAA
jgi:hypothetical protein